MFVFFGLDGHVEKFPFSESFDYVEDIIFAHDLIQRGIVSFNWYKSLHITRLSDKDSISLRAGDWMNFESVHVFAEFTIMQSYVKIPLATTLSLLLLLLITFCSANDNSSKPRDKVSLFNENISSREVFS